MADWLVGLIDKMGYAGIAVLMFLENLFPPIPSELIMPFGGYVAGKGELHIAGVLAAGTIGTLLGALLWYGIARKLGEKRLKTFAERHGRWLALSPDEIDKLNGWFKRHCL